MKISTLVFICTLGWIVFMTLVNIGEIATHEDTYPPTTPSNNSYVDGSVCDRIHCPW